MTFRSRRTQDALYGGRINEGDMLTAERARQLFTYDADTGEIRWAVDRHCGRGRVRCAAGTLAGGVNHSHPEQRPRRDIQVEGKRYKAHQLAWLIALGEWPPAGLEIDHKNRNPLDNRLSNLRLVTKSQNQWNRDADRRNASGFKGVSKHACGNRWAAEIKAHGKRHRLGLFKTPEEAAAAYQRAAAELHGEYGRN
jgi:HNH endonuclease/AP2 domain